MSVDLDALEQQYNLPSGLLSAVQQQESSGNPNAVNNDTATGQPSIGAFQFQPATAKQYNIDPTDPDQAAHGAAMMFSDLSKKYKGDVPSMLAAYNWGQGNLDRKGMENAPQETQDYINKILPKVGGLPQGTQYAAADTGNMSDATVDNSIPDLSKLSDADLDALEVKAKGAQTPDLSKMSDADLDALEAKIKGGQQPQGLIDALKNGDASFGMPIYKSNLPSYTRGQLPSHNTSGNISPEKPVTGQDLANAAAFIPATGAEMATANVMGKVLSPFAKEVGEETVLPLAARMMKGATTGAASGATYNASSGRDIGSGAEIGAAFGAGAPLVGDFLSPAAKAPEYDDIATHSAISDSYGAAKQGATPYYNFMREIGSGETADASQLKPALDSMITDIQNTPFHEAASELPYLKQQAAKIGDDGRMPLNDMVQLKQNLNSNFNPKRFAQGIDTPYSTVGGLVDDSLEDAAQRIPEFGQAKSLADKNWLNTVKSPFEDNTVLKKIWQPEDYYAKKSVDSGMLEQLPDPTQQRATAMLKNIKTPVQLNAVRRVLPQDLSDAFSQAKIADVIQKEGAGRLASAGKAVSGIPKIAISPLKGTGQVLTNLGRAVVPDLTPEGKALIDAAKSPAPTLSTKYQQPFSALRANVQQQKDLAGEMQPFGGPQPSPPKPKPTLSLPDIASSTERPMIGGRGQQPRQATDEEWQNIIDLDKRGKEMGLPMDVRKAQQQALISEYERNNPASNFFNTIGNKPFRVNQTALHPNTGDVGSLFPDKEGMKKGGLIKNRQVHLSKKLEVKLGRKPKAREVELAEYVGAHGVHRLLNQKDVSMPAHKMFPQETVRQKRELFFNEKKPYSVEHIRKALG